MVMPVYPRIEELYKRLKDGSDIHFKLCVHRDNVTMVYVCQVVMKCDSFKKIQKQSTKVSTVFFEKN